MPTTADAPKCFAEVEGQRLLDWALDAFRANGLSDICFIGGYQIDKVRADYPHFTFRQDAGWERNNILLSLMHAENLMAEGFVCCLGGLDRGRVLFIVMVKRVTRTRSIQPPRGSRS